MRFPLPLLGALVVAFAAVYLVTVHTQASEVVINGTALSVGQNITLTLSYMPHTIVTYLNADGTYQLTITAPGIDFAVGEYIYHEKFVGTVSETDVASVSISVVKAAPGKIAVTIVLERTA